MNLHSIVSGAIGTVNPFIEVTLTTSNGFTTGAGGKRTPLYNAPVVLSAQVQQLTNKDLRQLEGLNIQGSMNSIYLNGVVQGIVRVSQKGGDLITIATVNNAGVWLTTAVLEQWPDWVKVAVTLQNGA